MRLNRLELRGFGCLGEREFVFAPGLNVILGPNESGKSTLRQALVAALFGFYQYRTSGGRRSEGEARAEERYCPWTAHSYGCTVEYALQDGRCYRLERHFSTGSRKRETRLIDLASGNDLEQELERDGYGALSPDCELRFVGTTREVFAGSACIGQGEVEALLAPEALNEALERAIDTGGGSVSVRKADKALEKARDEWAGGGKASPLSKARARVQELEQKLSQWRKSLAQAAQDEQERDIVQKELAAARERLARLETQERAWELLELERKLARVNERQQRIQSLEAQLRELAPFASFPDGLRDDIVTARADLDRQRQQVQQLEESERGDAPERARLEQELARLQQEAQTLEGLRSFPGEREREFMQLEAALHAGTPPGRASPIPMRAALAVAGLVVAAALAALVGFLSHHILAGVAFAIMFLILAALLRPSATRAQGDAGERLATFLRSCGIELPTLQEGLEEFQHRLGGWRRLRDLDSQVEALMQKLGQFQERSQKLGQVRAELGRCEEGLRVLYARAGIQAQDLEECWHLFDEGYRKHGEWLDEKQKREAEQRELEALLNNRLPDELRADRDRLLAEGADAAPSEGLQPAELAQELTQARKTVHELSEKLAELKGQLKRALPNDIDPAALEEELAEKRREITILEQFGKVIVCAQERLRAAADEARGSVLPLVQERSSALLQRVSSGRYERVQVSFQRTLQPSLRGPGLPRAVEVESLSMGTREQCFICLRLALAEALGGNEPLPLVLDDPFVNCDEQRLGRLLELLAQLSRERQVLLFTKDEATAQRLEALCSPETGMSLIKLGSG